MSRYQPLADFLAGYKGESWETNFAAIERTLGRPLPPSAYRYQAWWANQSGAGHSQTHGWCSVGWRTASLDLGRRTVRFERARSSRHANEPAANDNLWQRARALSGITDDTRLVEEALRLLIAREAARQLAELGGSMPDYSAPARERP